MEAPGFWDAVEVSQQKMKELKSLKSDVETFQALSQQLEDVGTLMEMAEEEQDTSLLEEVEAELDAFEETFEGIRMKKIGRAHV